MYLCQRRHRIKSCLAMIMSISGWMWHRQRHCTIVMCGAVMVFGAWLPAMSVWLKLGLQIVCGAAVYIVLAGGLRSGKLLFSGGNGEGTAENLQHRGELGYEKNSEHYGHRVVFCQNVISACHAAGMRVVGCDIYPAEWVVNSRDVDDFTGPPTPPAGNSIRNFLKELCKKEQASVLMPLTDVEIDVIQQWRTELAEDFKMLDAEVWLSDASAVSLCRNKEKMEVFLRERKLCRTIPGVRLAELETMSCSYPLVAKPFDGRSSQGLRSWNPERIWNFCCTPAARSRNSSIWCSRRSTDMLLLWMW